MEDLATERAQTQARAAVEALYASDAASRALAIEIESALAFAVAQFRGRCARLRGAQKTG